MKAEDTVMGKEQYAEIFTRLWHNNIYGKNKNEPPSLAEYSKVAEETQAEISFKAGERQGYTKGFDEGLRAAKNTAI